MLKRAFTIPMLLALALALGAGPAPAAGPAAQVNPVVQRVKAGPYDYVLQANGNIWIDNGLMRKLLDDGTGTIMMAGEYNSLFILKKTSQVWWYDGKGWNMIDEGEGTVRIYLEGGAVHAEKQNGDVWRCTMKKAPTGEWVPDWARCAPKAAAPAAPKNTLPAGAAQQGGDVESRSGRP